MPYFDNVESNPARLAQINNLPAPNLTYVIYFTPRSGSSRVTEILGQTRKLGEANEAFNPNFMPSIAQAVQASDLQSYQQNLSRWLNRNGVFSFEITGHQLRKVFPQVTDFFDIYAKKPSFWLIRKDIVAQAVSLAKMVTLNIAHTAQSDIQQRAAAENLFVYDPAVIKRWLNHILVAERNCEEWFKQFNITPFRMSYEDLVLKTATEIVGYFAQKLNLPALPEIEFSLRHQKMATSRNLEFATQFRLDEAVFLAKVAKERQPWLDALNSAQP